MYEVPDTKFDGLSMRFMVRSLLGPPPPKHRAPSTALCHMERGGPLQPMLCARPSHPAGTLSPVPALPTAGHSQARVRGACPGKEGGAHLHPHHQRHRCARCASCAAPWGSGAAGAAPCRPRRSTRAIPACMPRPARRPRPACFRLPTNTTRLSAGSEVTPFAVVTDEKTGQKYPLADCECFTRGLNVLLRRRWHGMRGGRVHSGTSTWLPARRASIALPSVSLPPTPPSPATPPSYLLRLADPQHGHRRPAAGAQVRAYRAGARGGACSLLCMPAPAPHQQASACCPCHAVPPS